ncbi:hypothetical protein F4861DRAFT_532917 [Xylaria intraflava]|nr:hypothetical protein F4861DRAFT_532917 [Xylaria intraflava]
MFSIDPSLLPSLPTRKALLVVDAQNDFLAEDGPLTVKFPSDLPERLNDLASNFRRNGGEIIWVQSQFETSRPVADEQILTDASSQLANPAPGRGGHPRTAPLGIGPARSPEAFLTVVGKGQPCVRPGAPGTEMHPVVKQAVGPKDHVLVKTFYSAFKVDELLRLLRVRLVTELFICGSSTNIGVMATAIEAASHGYSISIVEDCCGSQSMSQHRAALRRITTMTGCTVLRAAEVQGAMKPQSITPERPGRYQATAGDRSPTVRLHRGKEDAVAPSASAILSSIERLSLSDKPAADAEHMPEIPAQQQSQRQRPRPSPALQPLASLECPAATAGVSIYPSPGEPAIASAESTPSAASRKNGTMAPQDANSSGSGPLCEGDTKVIYDLLPEPLVHNIFERIRCEVDWQRMSHQGGEVPRLVAVQGQVEADGSKPIYRHPADESPPLLPFTPAVDEISRAVEAKLQHPLNHVLIQFYRDGNDYISEHSDKTLDIIRDSFIANVSLGAERTMTLRTKRQPKDASAHLTKTDAEPDPTPADGHKRSIQRARLPHNSLFQMGLATNMRWMHAIRQDKRLAREKSAAELAYEGARISLTFRRIGTFLDGENRRIWGQGATGKTRDAAHDVINGQTPEAVSMLKAFGRENQSTEFDWDAHYGGGFDVLHITAAARLFLSVDPVVNMRVQIMLAELGVGYARGSMADQQPAAARTTSVTTPVSPAIKFIDNDEGKTTVEGQRDIMLYLQKTYGEKSPAPPGSCPSSTVKFEKGLALLDDWRTSSDSEFLTPWEKYAAGKEFISGSALGLADFVVWPVLHFAFAALEKGEGENGDAPRFPNLWAYYHRVRAREAVAQTLASGRY